jgi:hypothetical protein
MVSTTSERFFVVRERQTDLTALSRSELELVFVSYFCMNGNLLSVPQSSVRNAIPLSYAAKGETFTICFHIGSDIGECFIVLFVNFKHDLVHS